MVRIFEAGQRPFATVISDRFPELSEGQMHDMHRMWATIEDENPKAFPGEAWACRKVRQTEDALGLEIGRTNYALSTYVRRTKQNVPGALNMGTSVFVFDRRTGDLMMAKRSDRNEVVADPDSWSATSGGVLDTKTPVRGGRFVRMVREEAVGEMGHEVEIVGASPLRLVHLAVNEGGKGDWCFAIEVDDVRLIGSEAKNLEPIKRRDVPGLLDRNLEMTARWHLEELAGRIAQTTGLDFARTRR
jgi:hypothetical protein